MRLRQRGAEVRRHLGEVAGPELVGDEEHRRAGVRLAPSEDLRDHRLGLGERCAPGSRPMDRASAPGTARNQLSEAASSCSVWTMPLGDEVTAEPEVVARIVGRRTQEEHPAGRSRPGLQRLGEERADGVGALLAGGELVLDVLDVDQRDASGPHCVRRSTSGCTPGKSADGSDDHQVRAVDSVPAARAIGDDRVRSDDVRRGGTRTAAGRRCPTPRPPPRPRRPRWRAGPERPGR